jgi:translation initiation factor 1
MSRKKNEDNIVYSFTLGDTPKPYSENQSTGKYRKVDDGFIRIQLEKNSRGGKTVCVVFNLPESLDINQTAADLKKKCGTGGTIKENRIEIQGDKRDIIEKYFTDQGFKIKRIGG